MAEPRPEPTQARFQSSLPCPDLGPCVPLEFPDESHVVSTPKDHIEKEEGIITQIILIQVEYNNWPKRSPESYKTVQMNRDYFKIREAGVGIFCGMDCGEEGE